MILAVLQARVSSSRLPGKVLLPILGAPMLSRQLERVRRASRLSRLVVATSTESSDDAIEQLCEKEGVDCFRGSLTDVLDRFYHAARPYRPEHVVRLTGDCPLSDPDLIDQMVAYHLEQGFDYTTNALEPTYPDGLDVEVFRYHCLEEAWGEAKLSSQREHVTPYIHQHPERYRIGHYKSPDNWSQLRWTVDEKADFQLVEMIYSSLYRQKPDFNTADVLGYLNGHPHLMEYNTNYQRNEGYEKSLKQDLEG